MHRPFRKPLIVMSPKSLLRHPRAVSTLADLADGKFQSVIGDSVSPGAVQRLLLCSGKIYYALEKERSERDRSDVAIVRVEQLYPFPATELGEMLRRYSSATQIRWVQEEPRNQGAWEFVAPRLRALDSRDIGYVGREEAASPATGSYKIHQAEEAAILDEALRRPRSAGADGPRLQDRAAG